MIGYEELPLFRHWAPGHADYTDFRASGLSDFRTSFYLAGTIFFMSNKTRSVIKIIAVVMVLLAVMINIGWLSVVVLNAYKFWMVIIAFALVLITSR
jgi:hypothetical protein